MKTKKRGFGFIVDGILAASLIVLGTIFLHQFSADVSIPTPTRTVLAYDVMQSLSELKVDEANNSYVQELIANGTLTNLNNSILEQIGEFWAAGQLNLAENLAASFLTGLESTSYGIGLFLGDDLIYEINGVGYTRMYSAKKLISGISTNRTRLGYNARAVASRTRKNNTKILMGDVILSSVKKPTSGNNQNNIIHTYEFTVPQNTTIINAYWFIQAAYIDNKFKAYINDVFIPGSSASGSKFLSDLESYLTAGTNNLTVESRFGSNGPEGGDDGASHFVMEYSTESRDTLPSSSHLPIAQVTSECSIRYKKAAFSYGQLSSLSVYLNAVGPNATLKYTLDGNTTLISTKTLIDNHTEWNNSEILAAVQEAGHSYSDFNNKYFWFIIDIDTYHSQELKGDVRKILDGSYVSVLAEQMESQYGYIDITSTLDDYTYSDNEVGDFYRHIEYNFNITNGSIPLMLDSQIAWRYVVATDPDQTVSSNAVPLFSHPPNPLIEELARFGYTPHSGNFTIGANTYTLDFTNGYSADPIKSLAALTVLVPGMISYGQTFNTANEAISDAVSRLNDTLSQYVSVLDISSNVISIGGVPSMWGPTISEVRIWE